MGFFFLFVSEKIFSTSFYSSNLQFNLALNLRAMAERKLSEEESEQRSLLSGLGSSSPKPRVMLGGMFCSVEGAFENKTLNFESFSPSSTRRQVGSRRYSHTLSESRTHTPSSRSEVTESSSLHEQTVTHITEDQQVSGATQEVRLKFMKVFFCTCFVSLLVFDIASVYTHAGD